MVKDDANVVSLEVLMEQSDTRLLLLVSCLWFAKGKLEETVAVCKSEPCVRVLEC